MKKVIIIILVTILVFILFIKIMWYIIGGNVYSIVGSTETAVLDSNGDIVIVEEDITNQPTFISYKYEGVSIGILAIKNSKDKVMVVVNTCEACGEDPNGYFLLKGNKLKNQSCGNEITIDDLEDLNGAGCDPIKIIDRREEEGKIIIGTSQLKELKDRFKNWRGPKE